MRDVKVKIKTAGRDELLKQHALVSDLHERAERIAAAAGPGMEAGVEIGANRARAWVRTATFRARHAEATRRALSSAIDAGR